MKMTRHIILASVLVLLSATSCDKGSQVALPWGGVETKGQSEVPIEFVIDDGSALTKAYTATTTANLTSIYVTALKSDNSQFFKNVNFTGTSGGSFTGGWYWPSSGTLSFFALNKSYTQTISGSTITVSANAASDGDVVRAVKTGVANKTATNALSFSHIYAALAGIVFTGASGYTVTINSLSYKLITTGTYNVSTDAWSSVGSLGSANAVSSPALSNTGIGALCVPTSNNCQVTVTYTCTKNGHSAQYTKSATVTLAKGYNNTVKGTLSPNVITLEVDINPWTGATEVVSEM